MTEPTEAAANDGWRLRAARVRWLRALFTIAIAAVIGWLLPDHVERARELPFVLKALMYAGAAVVLEHPIKFAVPNVLAALLLVFVIDDVKGASRVRRVLCQL